MFGDNKEFTIWMEERFMKAFVDQFCLGRRVYVFIRFDYACTSLWKGG